MSTALVTLTRTLAQKLDMGDGGELVDTLKATAFKGWRTVGGTWPCPLEFSARL